MANCIIIHGCPSLDEKDLDSQERTYDKHWMPWLKQQLEAKGISTSTPLMPEPWAPTYELFKEVFEKETITTETIFVGHSCGTAFLVRWLGETKKEIDTLILVAPWKIPETKQEEAFYNYLIDASIQERVKRIIYFTSNDEDEEGKESVQLFEKVLGGTVISLPDHGHYTLGDMETEVFPELLEQLITP